MTFSVVVPAYNEASNLERLLAVLADGFHRRGMAAETIVVANGCTDCTPQVCIQRGARCIETERIHPSRARNIGANAARGSILVFLDADVVPSDSWFDALARRPFPPDASLIAGLQVRIPPDASWVAAAWQAVRLQSPPSYINSANCIVPLPLFRRLGGFDEARRAGEDVDFCRRAREEGAVLVFDPALLVHHFGEPNGLREFLARQRFHSEPLPVVLRGIGTSPTNFLIVAVFSSWVVSFLSCLALLFGAPRWIGTAICAGPLATFVAGAAKARFPLGRDAEGATWAAKIAVSSTMYLARVFGMLWPSRGWRSGN